jgi:hypothetical protein
MRVYPVLSILTKDVMTVSITTTSDTVEMISCLKDWEPGAT